MKIEEFNNLDPLAQARFLYSLTKEYSVEQIAALYKRSPDEIRHTLDFLTLPESTLENVQKRLKDGTATKEHAIEFLTSCVNWEQAYEEKPKKKEKKFSKGDFLYFVSVVPVNPLWGTETILTYADSEEDAFESVKCFFNTLKTDKFTAKIIDSEVAQFFKFDENTGVAIECTLTSVD